VPGGELSGRRWRYAVGTQILATRILGPTETNVAFDDDRVPSIRREPYARSRVLTAWGPRTSVRDALSP